MYRILIPIALLMVSCSTTPTTSQDVPVAFAKANPSFQKQQKTAFKNESITDQTDRQHRYIYGMSVVHKQYETLAGKYKVAESNDYEVDASEVLFGVPSVGDTFSRHTLFHHKRGSGKKDGMKLNEVVGYLEKHTIDPADVPVHVVQVNGQVVAMNNKDLAVLAMHGVPPEKIIKHSLEDLQGVGDDSVHEVLTNLERMPENKGSRTIYIRAAGTSIRGASRKSFAWDAPFARRVDLPVGEKESH